MNKLDFSIIIPAFNQEKYIKKCVKSALEQNFSGSFEVIVINDGSFDKTSEILKEFKDDRLKIFNNENSGAAYSRNFGIKKAVGEYIVFLDSDDILEKNALSTFYDANKLLDADIIQAPYYAIKEGKKTKFCFPLKKFKRKGGFLNIKNTEGEVLKGNFEPWAKAYNKKFLTENEIEFIGESLAEDLPFFYKGVLKAQKILLCDRPVYYYRRGYKALSEKENLIKSAIFALVSSDKIVKEYEYFSNIENIYKENCLNICLFWYRKFKKLKNKKVFFDFCIGYLKDSKLLIRFWIKSCINDLVDIFIK